jgi:Double-GTPase 2
MKGKCALPNCGVKDGLTCEDGYADLAKCPNFSVVNGELTGPEAGVVNDDGTGQRLPWTGRALGLSDMMLVSARSSPTLIGLIGPFNAGKTAFLTSLFVHFAQSGLIAPFSFSGSYTLQAWARLRQYTVWPGTYGPGFPPHTPDSAERVPSLLHLAFREGARPVRDLLFTDAPGEWFTRWIQNQSGESARGAQWIADHATHFLFFVDRDALAGPQAGTVRHDTLVLARVLSEQRRTRPVIAIWAKSDLPCAPDVEAIVRAKLQKFFGDHPSFEVHAEDPACLKVLALLLEPPQGAAVAARCPTLQTHSAFFAYQGTA